MRQHAKNKVVWFLLTNKLRHRANVFLALTNIYSTLAVEGCLGQIRVPTEFHWFLTCGYTVCYENNFVPTKEVSKPGKHTSNPSRLLAVSWKLQLQLCPKWVVKRIFFLEPSSAWAFLTDFQFFLRFGAEVFGQLPLTVEHSSQATPIRAPATRFASI